MNRLLSMGFRNVGNWTLTTQKKLSCNLISDHYTQNVLYSFVSNGIIKYIGKTSMELIRRMYGYQNPGPSQSTNIRVNKNIVQLLDYEQPVDILILVDNGLLKFGGYRINLAAGLEDTLINELDPIWNFSGRNRLVAERESTEQSTNMVNEERLNLTKFEVVIGKTYFKQGFFNVSEIYSSELGPDKAIIEILLGQNSNNSILGYINRSANINGSPRIMGGKSLADWIKRNLMINETLTVEIISSVSIRIYKSGL